MPDRFANSGKDNSKIKGMNPYSINRNEPSLRHGGDLEGIRQHLDYFNQLGVTALWFTPVLENNSPDHGKQSTYHGYATTDYYKVDPRFGTNEDYRRLVADAHKKGTESGDGHDFQPLRIRASLGDGHAFCRLVQLS